MSEILIGTSGFSYDDWKGEFYPPGVGRNGFLAYYCRYFKTLELNFSYYRIPSARQTGEMIHRSGGEVEFSVKANRMMTHEISRESLSRVVPLFLEGIAPLVEAARLGALLLQFPQSFHYIPENRIYLKSLLEALRPLPLAVEFRQREWLKKSVYSTLKDLGAGFVCVDEPPLPALIPPVIVTTSSLGYVRFHGRNSEKWYGTDSRTRYDYCYSDDELREWVPKIREMAKTTDRLYVFFNNHAKAQAVTNARMLMNLLAGN